MKQNVMKFAAAAALAAGMAFAQTAPAPQPNSGNGHFGMRHAARQRVIQALNLTDAQKQQAKTIFQQARDTAKPVRDQLKQNRQALNAAVKADNVSQIQSLAAQQGNLRGQLLAIRAEARAKFYATLTPDQKTKLDQVHQQLRERMQQRMMKKQSNG